MRGYFRAMVLLVVAAITSCQPDTGDEPIPFVPFLPYLINLSAPEFHPLTIDGGYKEIGAIGVRGVILYRQDAATYLAFERNCTFRPNEACATVNVHSSLLYMVDPCCSSTFSFAGGMPTGGVATRALRQYATELIGTQLTITDEIIN